MTAIKPTVGRKVWCTPSESDFQGPKPAGRFVSWTPYQVGVARRGDGPA